eukprot:16551-Chlamydomonas_euryale.AAC.2
MKGLLEPAAPADPLSTSRPSPSCEPSSVRKSWPAGPMASRPSLKNLCGVCAGVKGRGEARR